MTIINDFVVVDVVVMMIGLSSQWSSRKTRTMNILAVVAVEVTKIKTTTMMMTMTMTMITAKERRRI